MPLDVSKFQGETLLLWVHSSEIIGVLEHNIPQWGERGGSRGGVMPPCWRDIPPAMVVVAVVAVPQEVPLQVPQVVG